MATLTNFFWPWPTQPILVKLQDRPNRFVAEGVILSSGNFQRWHVPNTGSLLSVWEPGRLGLVLSDHPVMEANRTQGRLVAIQAQDTWVGIDTQKPNLLFRLWAPHWFKQEGIEILEIRPEYQSKPGIRWDAWVHYRDKRNQSQKALVEIKNVTLKVHHQAQFPDAKTQRGQKHLKGLMEALKEGWQAWLIFIVQRTDVTSLTPADEIDPQYGYWLRQAHLSGVKIWVWQCHIDPEGIRLHGTLPLELTEF